MQHWTLNPPGGSWIYQRLFDRCIIVEVDTQTSDPGRDFSVNKFFLTISSMKVVVNNQSSEAKKINANVPQSCPLSVLY